MTIDTIWYTRCPVPTAFAIAVKLGWLDEEFARDGIAFRSLAASTDRKIRQSHFEHTQANSVRHGGSIPPLVVRSRGADLRLVGLSISWSRQDILALPGSGIRTAEDLAGKRISIPRRVNDPVDFWRATVLRGFDLVLGKAGLSLDDVVPVDLKVNRSFVDDATAATGKSDTLWDARSMLGFQREDAAALLAGEVDAVFTQGTSGIFVQAYTGAQIIAEVEHSDDPSDYINNQPFTLTVSTPLIEDGRELAARLVAQVQRAAGWAKSNEREAKRIIAAETGIAEELVDYAYGANIHRELDIDLSPAKIAALRTEHDDLLGRDFLVQPVDIEAFLDRRPLALADGVADRHAARAVAAE